MKKSVIKSINKLVYIAVAALLCVAAGGGAAIAGRNVAYAASNSYVTLYETTNAGGTDFSGAGSIPLDDSSDWRTYLSTLQNGNDYTGFKFLMKRDFTNGDAKAITTGNYVFALTIDLNGHRINGGQSIQHSGRTLITDSTGGGFGSLTATGNTVIEYRGSDSTICEFYVSSESNYISGGMTKAPLQIYSGKVSKLVNNASASKEIKITEYLPEGYAYVADSGEMIPYDSAYKLGSFVGSASFSSIQTDYLRTAVCYHESVKDGVCVYCNADVDGYEALETAKKEIENAKNELIELINAKVDSSTYETAVANLKKAIEDANAAIETNKAAAETADADLKKYIEEQVEGLDQYIEAAKTDAINQANANLATAKEELKKTIDDNKTATDNSIKEINTNITAMKTSIDTLNAVAELLGSDSETDNALAKAIKTAIANAKQAAIDAANDVQSNLDKATTELTNNINKNASDIGTINGNIKTMQTSIDTLNAVAELLGSDSETDNALAKAIKTAIANAKQAAIDAANDVQSNLDKATTELTNNINKNASDIGTINGNIKTMQTSIDTLNAVAELLGSNNETDNALATAIKTAIANAKQAAIDAANDSLTEAKEELENAIKAKADAATLNEMIDTLTKKVDNAQAISDASSDRKDEAVKVELESNIRNAKDTLQSAVDALSARLDKAEAQIDKNAEDIAMLKSVSYAVLGVLLVVGIIAIMTGAAVKSAVKVGASKNDKNE